MLTKKIKNNLTKQDKRNHIKNCGKFCPFCNSDNNISYNEFSYIFNSLEVEQKAKCEDCGQKWVDIFRLVDVYKINSIKNEKGKKRGKSYDEDE